MTILADVLNARQSLDTLSKLPMPLPLSFKLSLLIQLLKPHLAAFEDQRNRLVLELGVALPDGSWQVPEAVLPAFHARVNELAQIPVELTYPTITIQEFPSTLEVTPETLLGLLPFIKE